MGKFIQSGKMPIHNTPRLMARAGMTPKASLDTLVNFAIQNSRRTDHVKYWSWYTAGTVRGLLVGIPIGVVILGCVSGCWTTLDKRPWLTYWTGIYRSTPASISRQEIWQKDRMAPVIERNLEIQKKIAKGEASEEDLIKLWK